MDMKTWKGQVAAIGQGLMESVRQFPLEALLGVVYFAVFVFDKWGEWGGTTVDGAAAGGVSD